MINSNFEKFNSLNIEVINLTTSPEILKQEKVFFCFTIFLTF